MKGTITLTSLKKIPPSRKGEKRIFMWDDKVPKFGAYRTSTGRVVFVYQFRMHACRPTERLTIGRLGSLTPEQARSLAATAALKVISGINPIEERRAAFAAAEIDESLLVKNFVQHYLTNEIGAKKRRSAKNIRAVLERDICPHLGDRLISEITVPMVEKMLASLSERNPSAPRRALIQLKAMLNYAKRSQRIDKVAIEFMTPLLPPDRDRVLDTRELRRFIEAAHDLGGPRGDAYLCLLLLMKRVREVARMEWREINLEKWIWRLPEARSKNGKSQDIILPPGVIKILERQQPDPLLRIGPVFTLDGIHPVTLGSKMKAVIDANLHRRAELAAAAGRPMRPIERYVIHDLRTATATFLQDEELNVKTDVIDAALHHISGQNKVQRKYMQGKYVPHVGTALVQLEQAIDNIMADDDAWPGGRDLPPMGLQEMRTRVAALRAAWPKTGDKDDDESGNTG